MVCFSIQTLIFLGLHLLRFPMVTQSGYENNEADYWLDGHLQTGVVTKRHVEENEDLVIGNILGKIYAFKNRISHC